MLRAEKDGVFSKTYRITQDGRDVTAFESRWWSSGGTFSLEGRQYRIRSNMWGGRYGMADENEAKVASAEKVGRKNWMVTSADEVYRFQRASMWRSDQLLMRDGREVGSVRRASMWKGGAIAELPGLSLALQVFVVAVVLTMWEQQAAAAASS
ncbi:MAG: hypothetical protein L0I76_20230 [Pseudonocardia sp.]|nr:hypothetical protein [Pseudonocardia sp.]